MRIEFIRKSKDPKKWCESGTAIFIKDFKSVEEAVRWYANAYKSCYIWRFCKEWNLRLRDQFYNKLISQICKEWKLRLREQSYNKLISQIGEENIPRYTEDYWKYIKENKA